MAKNDSKEFQINECNDVFCSIARNPHCPIVILDKYTKLPNKKQISRNR